MPSCTVEQGGRARFVRRIEARDFPMTFWADHVASKLPSRGVLTHKNNTIPRLRIMLITLYLSFLPALDVLDT